MNAPLFIAYTPLITSSSSSSSLSGLASYLFSQTRASAEEKIRMDTTVPFVCKQQEHRTAEGNVDSGPKAFEGSQYLGRVHLAYSVKSRAMPAHYHEMYRRDRVGPSSTSRSRRLTNQVCSVGTLAIKGRQLTSVANL